MRQFRAVKAQHTDAIVFFRVGDFYEMFFEDAEEASKLLGIVLTARGKVKGEAIPLCGVPYHTSTGYIAKLLKAGKIVALCEQVEDPKIAKGLVRREVVRVYTPGTLYDHELLPAGEGNFLSALCYTPLSVSEKTKPANRFGLASMDLSTGEFWISESWMQHSLQGIVDELVRLEPKEVIFPAHLQEEMTSVFQSLPIARNVSRQATTFDLEASKTILIRIFQVNQFEDLQLHGLRPGLQAAGGLLHYLAETQPTLAHAHIRRPWIRLLEHEMQLDQTTLRNLEVLKPVSEQRQSPTLLTTLDKTKTPMGTRLLRQWIVRPLTQVTSIQLRQEAVKELVLNLAARMTIRDHLKSVQDLERLNSRIVLEVGNPRDLINLHRSLEVLLVLQELLPSFQSAMLQTVHAAWDPLLDVSSWIADTIIPNPPLSSKEGGIIREGVNAELDELRILAKEGTRLLAEMETRERNRTGIDSLKVKFNQVFGYYIEVTKSNLSRVPADYHRKQTLVNAERFTTLELQDLEGRLSSADQKMKNLEEQLFGEIRLRVASATTRIQGMAQQLAILDVITGLAEAASINRYHQPTVHEGGTIQITEGRHPVIEHLQQTEGFIPNDTILDLDTNRLLLITGPNMAGKSTYLRQVALIVLMAQIGSFVPAESARIGIVDRIFTRVGAADDLSAGQSTFMVEMSETARILDTATSRSLLLLDEVGRGTSTYDGLSIAWALAEYILDRGHLGARTLFATHYHEMTQLEALREGIKNYTVLVQEKGQDVLFLRKIVQGKADRSYGIQVAKLAGIPKSVLDRAKNILSQLEQDTSYTKVTLSEELVNTTSLEHISPKPHIILDEVKQMDLFSMTPLEALNKLADFKARLNE
ncbi:MAG: DNA mismatch repair protein MutS [Nitrospirales bacterium]|nr:DNA mismatch repair protein MutS [Nitrospirales bacterium]